MLLPIYHCFEIRNFRNSIGEFNIEVFGLCLAYCTVEAGKLLWYGSKVDDQLTFCSKCVSGILVCH